MNEHTPPTGEQVLIAASGLMHQIRTGRINAKKEHADVDADMKAFLYGEWDNYHYGYELDAVNTIAEFAGYGPQFYTESDLQRFWTNGFGKEIIRVRSTQGIINKASAHAEEMGGNNV